MHLFLVGMHLATSSFLLLAVMPGAAFLLRPFVAMPLHKLLAVCILKSGLPTVDGFKIGRRVRLVDSVRFSL